MPLDQQILKQVSEDFNEPIVDETSPLGKTGLANEIAASKEKVKSINQDIQKKKQLDRSYYRQLANEEIGNVDFNKELEDFDLQQAVYSADSPEEIKASILKYTPEGSELKTMMYDGEPAYFVKTPESDAFVPLNRPGFSRSDFQQLKAGLIDPATIISGVGSAIAPLIGSVVKAAPLISKLPGIVAPLSGKVAKYGTIYTSGILGEEASQAIEQARGLELDTPEAQQFQRQTAALLNVGLDFGTQRLANLRRNGIIGSVYTGESDMGSQLFTKGKEIGLTDESNLLLNERGTPTMKKLVSQLSQYSDYPLEQQAKAAEARTREYKKLLKGLFDVNDKTLKGATEEKLNQAYQVTADNLAAKMQLSNREALESPAKAKQKAGQALYDATTRFRKTALEKERRLYDDVSRLNKQFGDDLKFNYKDVKTFIRDELDVPVVQQAEKEKELTKKGKIYDLIRDFNSLIDSETGQIKTTKGNQIDVIKRYMQDADDLAYQGNVKDELPTNEVRIARRFRGKLKDTLQTGQSSVPQLNEALTKANKHTAFRHDIEDMSNFINIIRTQQNKTYPDAYKAFLDFDNPLQTEELIKQLNASEQQIVKDAFYTDLISKPEAVEKTLEKYAQVNKPFLDYLIDPTSAQHLKSISRSLQQIKTLSGARGQLYKAVDDPKKFLNLDSKSFNALLPNLDNNTKQNIKYNLFEDIIEDSITETREGRRFFDKNVFTKNVRKLERNPNYQNLLSEAEKELIGNLDQVTSAMNTIINDFGSSLQGAETVAGIRKPGLFGWRLLKTGYEVGKSKGMAYVLMNPNTQKWIFGQPGDVLNNNTALRVMAVSLGNTASGMKQNMLQNENIEQTVEGLKE